MVQMEVRMKQRLLKTTAVSLSAMMLLAQPFNVFADEDDDIAYIQSQQEETNSDLADLEAQISDLEAQKQALTDQIDDYNAQLVTTIASINSLDDQISDTEDKIAQTQQDLKDARQEQKNQEEGISKRIKYLYEEGDNGGWVNLLLTDEKLGLVMNNESDVASLYNYDRDALDSYTEITNKVSELEQQQLDQKSSLEVMKKEQEEGKAHLEDLLSQAQTQSDNTDQQISDANSMAEQYQALIEEQNEKIAELEQQKAEREAAEQAAAAAAAAAAQQAAETKQAQTVQTTGVTDSAATAATDNSASQYAGTSQSTQTASASQNTSSASQSTASNTGSSTASSDTASSASYDSSLGSQIVAYAEQFIGNPYVWGGTSLTNGCDCSGFTQAVFAHFGISLPRTSYAMASSGVGISYSEAQPGDIIVYSGHVGIYIGGGQIVNAANEQLGICISSATHQTIQTVRRLI